jgi:flavin-dependent dehydrogenase
MSAASADNCILEDGANIAVIGGGPSGSFFSIFALKMAKMVGKELNITIYEPKDFTKTGPAGCNHCGGVISELLVQTLAVEGINLPDTVVRKGINSYRLHTDYGSVFIATPSFDKTIATVYRGGGPKGMTVSDKESFDHFLLNRAIQEGAVHKPFLVDHIEWRNGRPVLFSRKQELMAADLAVGAFGLNSATAKLIEDMKFGYYGPRVLTAAIAEIAMGDDVVAEHFGNSIQLFLLPNPEITFAAMIPKGAYVTLCILGSASGAMHVNTVDDFLELATVKSVLPKNASFHVACRCLPKLNVSAPAKGFTDRVVMCGDAGATRLFKDGLGAAYLMGKAAAKTAVFRGIGERQFAEDYYPAYRRIIRDNYYGSLLYTVIGIYRKSGLLTKTMLKVVEKEQGDGRNEKIMSSMLWDMFTGNEKYRKIFSKAFKVKMHIEMVAGLLKSMLGR